MPPPERISGRLARASNAVARAMSAWSGRMRLEGACKVVGSIAKSSALNSCSPWQTSSGTSSRTGPGRPEVATAKARAKSSGTRAVCSTRINSLTAGRRISTCRHSWVMFFQEWVRLVSPAKATTGVPAFNASIRPVTRLVAPGPRVPSHTPGRLVTRA